MERMPFGLIDYNIHCFNAKNTVKLKMEDHYAKKQETMFAHFGHKWVSLNHGPMWQYDEEVQDVVKPNAECGILAEALRSSGVNVDDDIDVNDVSLGPELKSRSSSVVGNEAEVLTQNEEDDDLVPVSGLSAATCFLVEEDTPLSNCTWKRNTNPYRSDITPNKTNSNFQFFSNSHIHEYLSPTCIPG